LAYQWKIGKSAIGAFANIADETDATFTLLPVTVVSTSVWKSPLRLLHRVLAVIAKLVAAE
jgi:hypothetical protein